MHINKPENIFANSKELKILLLRHDRIGDILISTPFLKELRKIMGNKEIDILLSFKNKTASRAVEYLTDNILILDNKLFPFLKLIRMIRNERYDLVIDLLDNPSTTSNLILKYSGAKIKLGFDKANANNYNYVVPLPDKGKVHIAKRLFSLLLPFGYDKNPDNIHLDFPLKKTEKSEAAKLLGEKKCDLRLGINLSGSNDSKYWGDDKYIKFIKNFKSNYDVDVVLFALPKHSIKAEYIASQSGARTAPPNSDFNVFAAMLNECDLILTPDTSAVHLASAFNKPVVTLFVSPDPSVLMPWFPLNANSKSLVAKNNLAEIKVADVMLAFDELINGMRK